MQDSIATGRARALLGSVSMAVAYRRRGAGRLGDRPSPPVEVPAELVNLV